MFADVHHRISRYHCLTGSLDFTGFPQRSTKNQILRDLDGRFGFLLHSKKLDISGVEVIENRAPFNIPFLSMRVVEKNSAARYFGNTKLIPGTDHSSIVKPESVNSDSHLALIDFMVKEGFLEEIRKEGKLSKPSLFDRYSVEYEKYFIERDKDKELNKILSQYSVWVYGSTGVGKTASITRAIYRNNLDLRFISLGACIGSGISELFEVINSELSDGCVDDYGARTVVDNVKDISLKVSDMCRRNDLCLLIEEMPIQDEDVFGEFSNYIYVLLNSLSNSHRFRLVLSSISRPNIQVAPEIEKISERMRVVEWDLWHDKDVECLLEIISADLGWDVGNVMPSEFKGSPRNVKNYFRDELLKKGM